MTGYGGDKIKTVLICCLNQRIFQNHMSYLAGKTLEEVTRVGNRWRFGDTIYNCVTSPDQLRGFHDVNVEWIGPHAESLATRKAWEEQIGAVNVGRYRGP